MSKQRGYKPLSPWLSAKPDNIEKRFVQIGNTMLFSESFTGLSVGARYLYICMCMECGGKRSFIFPLCAATKYAIAPASFRRYVKELTESKFILVRSGANTRTRNEYEFRFDWKTRPP